MLFFLTLLALFLLDVTSARPSLSRSLSLGYTTIPAAVFDKVSTPIFTSSAAGLDGPKVSSINSSAYDWWYFDIVSPDLQSSVVVIFFTAPATAFPFSQAPLTDITEAYIIASVPGNPTLLGTGGWVPASEARVLTTGNGAIGDWVGTGFGFGGTPDLSVYDIVIDSKALGIKGVFTFSSTAPAHYPCGPAQAGQSLQIMPHVGWSNAIPSAHATASFTVNSTAYSFSGVGYHDKNWGDIPFTEAVASWYWGHATLGPYTLVWYSAIDHTGTTSVSAYLTLTSTTKVLLSSCSVPAVTVRPASGPYPPTLAGGVGNGAFSISLAVPGGKQFKAVVQPKDAIAAVAGGFYTRWIGSISGGLVGDKPVQGVALYEQFVLV